MYVKWETFDSLGYKCATEIYPYEADAKDFIHIHKGVVLYVRHEQPSFLRSGKTIFIVKDLDDKIQEVNATDCTVIYKFGL